MTGSQRFEFNEDGSSKFWEIEAQDCDVTTRWGRIGTTGQSKTKSFDSPAAAQREYSKLVKEKTSKGYQLTSVASTSTSTSAGVTAPEPPTIQVSEKPQAFVTSGQPIVASKSPDSCNNSAIEHSPSVPALTKVPVPATQPSDPVVIKLAPVDVSPFPQDSSATKWQNQADDLGCRRAGYFLDPTAGISVAGFQKPPNVLIAVVERSGIAWCEVVSFYSDKRCDAWSNHPGHEPEHEWLNMDHDPRATLAMQVTSSLNAPSRGTKDLVPGSQFAKYYSEYLTRKGLPTASDQSQETPRVLVAVDGKSASFEQAVMAYVDEYFKPYKRNATTAIDAVPTGKALLAHGPGEQAQIMMTVFKLSRRVINRTGYDVLFSLRQHLLKKKLPLSDADVDILCEELQKEFEERGGGIDSLLLSNIEHAAKSRPLSQPAREILRFVRDRAHDSWQVEKQAALQARIDVLLGETGTRIPVIEEGTEWTKSLIASLDAMAPESRRAWIDLLAHCVQATSSKASAAWLKAAAPLLNKVGLEQFHEMLASWPPLLSKANEVSDGGVAFMGGNQDILRGLIWCCAIQPNERTVITVRQIGVAAFKALNFLGPRTRVGNACVQVLGEIGTTAAVAQLAVMKTKVKNGTAQRGIAKQLDLTASRLGVSQTELEEISVPTLGMEEVGLRAETLGSCSARLVVTPDGANLSWFGSEGKPVKSVPTEVKNNHAEELKELKDAVKDIDSLLSAQRYRIESLYCIPHSWSLASWRDRYLDHPLVGVLARNLIWQFVDGTNTTSAIWHNGQLITSDDVPLSPSDQATVQLWHPLNEPADRVLAWRNWLIDHGVVQPFKQAHREIYLLTDAERQTGTYSNRFAAHILRQAQYRTLAQNRRWKVNFMGGFDGGDTGTARKEFPYHNLAAEFWLTAAGEVDPVGYGYAYGSTDQVRFYQPVDSEQPILLETVPPMIFSEAMRDVDLFVGVCSIGNDPTWMDAGHRDEAFNAYWRSQADAALIESGKTRRAVLEQILPRLKIAAQCELLDRVLQVRGKLRIYRIHLGSGNIMMEPNNHYLCIVPDRESKATSLIQLPFTGDNLLSVILSKAFLLADDDKIKDSSIVAQIRG